MTDPVPGWFSRRAANSSDEQYADAYTEGYADGLREILRELLAHAARGHSTQELRFLIESRLARVNDDSEVKRRSLLGPPRRPTWSPPHHPGEDGASRSAPPSASVTDLLFERGQSYLFREERPAAALEFLVSHAAKFPRKLHLGQRPLSSARLTPGAFHFVALGGAGAPATGGDGLDLGRAGGEVREATEAPGGALLFLDALEFLVTEYGVDATFRFVNFLSGQARTTSSVLVLSVDPAALDVTDRSRLQRLFNIVR